MALRRAAFPSRSVLCRSPPEMGPSESGSLHAGQRLAKPGLPGLSSNSSPQTVQTLMGNGIAVFILMKSLGGFYWRDAGRWG